MTSLASVSKHDQLLLSESELKSATAMIMRSGGALTLISGPTGTGKSSLLPPYIVRLGVPKEGGRTRARSIVVVPTVEAAKNLAARVGVKNPDISVGYAAESEVHYTSETDLVYATSGHARRFFLRKFEDPQARGFNEFRIIFLDEIHTGSVDNSLIINMWEFYVENKLGAIPRLVLVSATPVEGLISDKSLKMPVYEIARPSPFPVRIEYHDGVNGRNLVDKIVEKTVEIHSQDRSLKPGHILIFVAGIAQALTVESKLVQRNLDNVVILSIYSSKDRDERKEAFAEVKGGKRLILVATNIVESSVTINDVKYVISSMREKRPGKSATGGLLLEEHLVTQNSAVQQAGRTGRTCPGVVHRLISASGYAALEKARPLDITRVPIHNEILEIIEVGRDPFSFLGGAARVDVHNVFLDLQRLDMVTKKIPLQVTQIGKFATRYPLSIRSSAFLWIWFNAKRRGGDNQEPLPPIIGIIIACLINDDPSHLFVMPWREPGESEEAYEAKRSEHINEKFLEYIGSDHLVTVLNLWIAINSSLNIDLIFEDYSQAAHRRRDRNNEIRVWCKEHSISRSTLIELVKTIRRCVKVARTQGYDVRNGKFTAEGAAVYARPIIRHVYEDMAMTRIPGESNSYLHTKAGGAKTRYRLSTTGIPGIILGAANIVGVVIHEYKAAASAKPVSFIKFALTLTDPEVEVPKTKYLSIITPVELGIDMTDFMVPMSLLPPQWLAAGRLKLKVEDDTLYIRSRFLRSETSTSESGSERRQLSPSDKRRLGIRAGFAL